MAELYVCIKCGAELPGTEFSPNKSWNSGLQSSCKKCMAAYMRRLRLLKRPLPIYETHKFCKKCNRCLPIEAFSDKCYICGCVECYTKRITSKEFKEHKNELRATPERKEQEKASKKAYRDKEENRAKEAESHRKYRRRKAAYKRFASKLPVDDTPTDIGGKLYVACKKCGKLFRPTNLQCENRVRVINAVGKGENNFYCSAKCRDSCEIYKSNSVTPVLKPLAKKVKGCTKELKNLVVARQLAEVGYSHCEKCGKRFAGANELHLHHVLPIKDYLKAAHEEDMAILLCQDCHFELHKTC